MDRRNQAATSECGIVRLNSRLFGLVCLGEGVNEAYVVAQRTHLEAQSPTQDTAIVTVTRFTSAALGALIPPRELRTASVFPSFLFFCCLSLPCRYELSNNHEARFFESNTNAPDPPTSQIHRTETPDTIKPDEISAASVAAQPSPTTNAVKRKDQRNHETRTR